MSFIIADACGNMPVLDLEGACEFLELTRSEMMVLVPQAVIEIREKCDLVRLGMGDGELPTVALNAHTIKSVAASIGAASVSRTAESLEMTAKRKERDRCVDLVSTLEHDVVQLFEAVDRL